MPDANETEETPDTFNDVMTNEALVNITWNGQNGDMSSPIAVDSSEEEIRQWVTEAVQNGSVPGITTDADADFSDFVVDRFPPSDSVPHHRVFLRPKTPFGNYIK